MHVSGAADHPGPNPPMAPAEQAAGEVKKRLYDSGGFFTLRAPHNRQSRTSRHTQDWRSAVGGRGFPPKPAGTARRRNATLPTTLLPARGWQGEVPAWPIIDDISLEVKRAMLKAKGEALQDEIEETDSMKTRKRLEREMETATSTVALLDRQIEVQRELEVDLWKDLWRTPQAKMWADFPWNRDVAQYVRWKVLAEMGNLEAAKESRRWSDRLGLNPAAMLRLRWEIERVHAAVSSRNNRGTSTTAKPGSQKARRPKKWSLCDVTAGASTASSCRVRDSRLLQTVENQPGITTREQLSS